MATNMTAIATPRVAGAGRRRFGLVVQTNMVLFVRNRIALFWVIAFPIGLMLLFGTMYGKQPIVIPYLTSGMIVVSLLANGLIGNAGAMAVWRERGILRRIQTTPLPVWQLLLGRVLAQAVIMALQALLLVATSVVVFGASYQVWNIVQALPAILVGAVFFMACGQAVAALVQKSESVNIIAQVIYFPLMFLGGLMIPLSQLPDTLQTIGKFLPSSMVVDLIRTPLLGEALATPALPLPLDLAGLAVYFGAAVFVAARFFKWS